MLSLSLLADVTEYRVPGMQPTTMKRDWARIGITLYGVGVILATFCSFQFFLGQYTRDNPTVSADYRHLIRWAKETGTIVYLVALPFLICGIIGYGRDVLRASPTGAEWRVLFWVKLFIPNWNDPFLTLFAKTYLVLVFVALFVFGVTSQEGITESAFIRRVICMYSGLFVLAVILTVGLKHLRDRREPRDLPGA